MAFESVNVTSLKQSINSCIQKLNDSSINEVFSNVSNNNIWQTSSSGNLKKALGGLVNLRYRELKEYLNKCLSVADRIERYKELEKEIIAYQNQIAELNAKIASTVRTNKTYVTKSGDTAFKVASRYGVSPASLLQANGGGSGIFSPGRVLVIPGVYNYSNNISYLKSQITDLNNKISQCTTEMEQIEAQILK